MHGAAFATAALPAPVRILKLTLRPYSVGHQLWLEAERNPLAGEALPSEITARHVIEAVWICAHSWAELQAMPHAWLPIVKIAIWHWLNRRENIALACADFQNYRRAGSTLPPVESAQDSSGREAGGPLLARLIQFLITDLEKSEAEAMDYPHGLAQWHLAISLERKGLLNILNDGELEFEAWCRTEDAKAAAITATATP